MIKAIEINLQRGINLLNSISDSDYSEQSIPPYFSSIGCHIRHVLDMFTCVLNGVERGNIDLTNRERNQEAEQKCYPPQWAWEFCQIWTRFSLYSSYSGERFERPEP